MSNYLIKDDAVQLDRAIYLMRMRIAVLKDENEKLRIEIQQLRNRPDPSPQNLTLTRSKEKIDMDLPVEQWHTRHFIKYFQTAYEQKYTTPRVVSGKEWHVFAVRIKTFRDSHIEIQDNAVFKRYIDWLFKEKFTRKFVASVPLVCANSLFYEWVALTPPKKSATTPRRTPTEADLKALEAEFEKVLANK